MILPISCSRVYCPLHKFQHQSCYYFGPRQASSLSCSKYQPKHPKTFVVADIIAQNDCVSTTIIGADYRAKSFLSCCIPYLQLHFLATNFHLAEFEVNSNSREQFIIKFSVNKLAQNGRLAQVKHELPTAESPTSTSLYSVVITGIMIGL